LLLRAMHGGLSRPILAKTDWFAHVSLEARRLVQTLPLVWSQLRSPPSQLPTWQARD
jgi:hypothetical protein